MEIRRLLYLVDDLGYVAFMSKGGEAREGVEGENEADLGFSSST